MSLTAAPTSAPKPTTRDEVRDLAVLPVWSGDEPSAAGVLGISRSLAYDMAATGGIPTIRLGARIVVPVPALLALLGEPSA